MKRLALLATTVVVAYAVIYIYRAAKALTEVPEFEV